MRRTFAWSAVAMAAAVLPIPAEPARAAPACASVASPAPDAVETPWPHRRVAPSRLDGLATGAGQVVAVIDSGVDAGHPQLAGAVSAGADFLDRGGSGRDDCVGHGTAIASIIAARPRTGTPVRGLAPAATILPVRVSERVPGTDGGRAASPAGLAAAIRFAADRGATVINLSLTLDVDEPAVRAAIAYAAGRNAVIVAAAGNAHRDGVAADPPAYPAGYPDVVGVGAVGPDGHRLPSSQVGDHVDLTAPGGDVVAAARGGGHVLRSGTSFAAAFVSASAALVRQYRPGLTARQVADRLRATADIGPDGGPGIVNPYRAVAEHLADAPAGPPAPPVASPAAADERTGTRTEARIVAAAGAGLIALALLAASALPRGTRRRWRPGRPGGTGPGTRAGNGPIRTASR